MTQMNIQTTEVGWGPLSDDLKRAKAFLLEVKASEAVLVANKSALLESLQKLNNDRRERVLDLLKAEDRAICLLHKLIFRDSNPGDWLAPNDGVVLVRMVKSWIESHRVYDGDPDYTNESFEYDSTACKVCLGLVTNGTIKTIDNKNNTKCFSYNAKVNTREELYTHEILNEISAGYYQMPVVDSGNLESL